MSEETDQNRRRFLSRAALAIAAGQLGMIVSAKPLFSRNSELSSLEIASAWLNSQPLTAAALHGKVVVVDFWTYSCINWRRQLPYVRAWAEKYKNHGLVVIGVHAPEFSFERNMDNVRQATKDVRIDYPVVIDNDYAICARSITSIGPRSISSMHGGASDTISSAKANTNNRRKSFNNC